MGIPNECDSPELIAMLQSIIDAADERHIPTGCWFGKPEQAQSARACAVGGVFNDSSMLKDAMSNAFGQLRKV